MSESGRKNGFIFRTPETKFLALVLIVLLQAISAQLAVAQIDPSTCVLWQPAASYQENGQTYNSIFFDGGPIGYAVPGSPAYAGTFDDDTPLSALGISCACQPKQGSTIVCALTDNLSQLYTLTDDDDDQKPDPCSIPGNPFCGGGGGGGSGGGGGGGSGGGGSGGGGSTANNRPITLPEYTPPSGSTSGQANPNEITSSVAKEIIDGTQSSGSANARTARRSLVGQAAQTNPNNTADANALPFRSSRAMMFSTNHNQMFEGIHSAPVLIDPWDIKEAYPNLVAKKGTAVEERPSLGEAMGYPDDNKELPEPDDIGVDDEYVKTSLAINQPIMRLHNDFYEDENARDNYLNSATTLRGVTVMAMGFLDKTLGAGLVALQQQADHNTMQHLLTQISWTSARLANFEREQEYKDTDEKLEACLEWSMGTEGKAKKEIEIGDTTRERVHFECSDECGDAPKASDKKYRPEAKPEAGKAGNGSYAYCVCCAQTADTLNALAEDGSREAQEYTGETKELFSLMERAVLGVAKEENGTGQPKESVKLFLRGLILAYGDVKIIPKQVQRPSGLDDQQFFTITQLPLMSPQRMVALYKNRCYHPEENIPASDLHKKAQCLGQDDEDVYGIKYGIGPAGMEIISNWDQILKGQQFSELTSWWVEFSLGHPINARDIKELLALNGDSAVKIDKGKESLEFARVYESFIESSAVAALVRFHSRMSAYIKDKLALSNVLTRTQEAQVEELLNRYSHYIALAESDATSKYLTEATLAGVSIQFDRWKTAQMGSVSQAMVATGDASSKEGGILGFFSGGNRVTAGGGGGAGGGGNARTIDPNLSANREATVDGFRQAFGENTARTFSGAIAQGRDPIEAVFSRAP